MAREGDGDERVHTDCAVAAMILSPDSSGRILDGLRLAAIAGQFTAIGAAMWLFGDRLSGRPLLIVAGAFAAWHLWGVWRRHRGGALTEARLTAEILVDVVVVSALLCLAGGWTNPFVSIFLVPVGFAAAMLAVRRALTVAAAAFCGYLFNIAVFVPLPVLGHPSGGGFELHLFGMLVSFVLAAVVLLATVLLVRRAYDAERLALARERESRLRDEQLLSLGVLAASTAHELGTPLSTARMLVETMTEDGSASAEDLALLGRNLDQASATLHRLVGVAQSGGDGDVTVDAFCAQIADRFRTLRPEAELVTDAVSGCTASISDSRLLESAVLSLLVNAATASAQAGRSRVEFAARLDGNRLTLHVRDFGHGFGAASHRRNDARGGLGMGLAISSATIERYDGEAHHYPRDPGTEVVVSLPLQRLQGPI